MKPEAWVSLDIDNTLGDYHRHFLRCAEMFLDREMPDPRVLNPGLPLHQFMQVSKATYREIKMAYRQGRWKRSMPVFDGARDLSVAVRSAGARVAICTTRPFNQLGVVDADTRWWLRHHGIQHDILIWGPNKYNILRQFIRRECAAKSAVVAALEDELGQHARGHSLGIPMWLYNQPYNRQDRPLKAKEYWVIQNLEQAQRVFLNQIEDWEG